MGKISEISEEITTNDIVINNELKLSTKEKIKNKFFFKSIAQVLIIVVMALLIKQFLICTVYIPSSSMVPTLNIGDHILVTRVCNLNNLRRGDIIVFDSKELNKVLIKRLIGLPGDDIKIINGKVSVNGEELEESYVENHDDFKGEYRVPEEKYFFLGDNRPDSFDARLWEDHYIDGKDIKAKAQIKVYPFKDLGIIK